MYSPGEGRVCGVYFRMCWTFRPRAPGGCFDETSVWRKRGLRSRPSRHDGSDLRVPANGTRNLFMLCEPPGWRRSVVPWWAQQMRWLADEAYPASIETTSTPTNQLPSTLLGEVRKRLRER